MSANTEAQGSGRGLEAMKWIIVAVLLIVAIVGNFLYRDIMLAVRALAVVILIAAAGGVALLTTKGKATVAFAREARTEVRKVIWPTPPPLWQLLPRAQITTCPWSLLPLPLRPLPTMPRPTP